MNIFSYASLSFSLSVIITKVSNTFLLIPTFEYLQVSLCRLSFNSKLHFPDPLYISNFGIYAACCKYVVEALDFFIFLWRVFLLYFCFSRYLNWLTQTANSVLSRWNHNLVLLSLANLLGIYSVHAQFNSLPRFG